jgi:hypothetical protein
MSKDKSQKRVPVNTEREVRRNPLGFIAEATVTGTGDAILRQESQGQRSFVDSETLPTEGGRYSDYDEKAILEAVGVKFGEVIEGDPLFQHVELPAGWKKVATDHSMWSKLLDDKGRERASIFYKAAFYDRGANMSLTCRFGVNKDYERQDSEGVAVAVVTDAGQVIHTTEPIAINDKGKPWEEGNQAVKTAIKWLEQRCPDWRNPGAYWD